MNKQKIRNLRLMSMGVITLLVVIGGAAGAGTGTLSSFGWKTIHIVCPLGYLETALAGRDFIPGLLICFLIITGLTILMGRFFCGWICPVPLVRKLFTNKVDESNDVFPKKKNKDDYENHVNQNTALNEAVLQRNQDLKTANVSFSQECPKPEKKSLTWFAYSWSSSCFFGCFFLSCFLPDLSHRPGLWYLVCSYAAP